MVVLVYAVLAMRKVAVKIETVQPDDKYVKVHIINFIVTVSLIVTLFIIGVFNTNISNKLTRHLKTRLKD